MFYFKITNVGSRSGSEVPQLYIEDKKIKKLKAFKRIFLDKGESLDSSLKIAVSALKSWDIVVRRIIPFYLESIVPILGQVVKTLFLQLRLI